MARDRAMCFVWRCILSGIAACTASLQCWKQDIPVISCVWQPIRQDMNGCVALHTLLRHVKSRKYFRPIGYRWSTLA